MALDLNMVKAVIFDMDGLLVNSEPYWKKAVIRVFEGLGLQLNDELYLQTQGLRIEDVVDYWAARIDWPENKSKAEVVEEVLQEMEYLIGNECELMPGALDTIEKFKDYPRAIASSSPMRLINAFVDHHNLRDKFKVLRSAEFEPYGKPYPGVYIHACDDLGVSPLNAMAFEDSFNGVLAARAAQMQVIAVPEEAQQDRADFVIAQGKYRSLNEFLATLD